jgi:hypothetical protein
MVFLKQNHDLLKLHDVNSKMLAWYPRAFFYNSTTLKSSSILKV